TGAFQFRDGVRATHAVHLEGHSFPIDFAYLALERLAGHADFREQVVEPFEVPRRDQGAFGTGGLDLQPVRLGERVEAVQFETEHLRGTRHVVDGHDGLVEAVDAQKDPALAPGRAHLQLEYLVPERPEHLVGGLRQVHATSPSLGNEKGWVPEPTRTLRRDAVQTGFYRVTTPVRNVPDDARRAGGALWGSVGFATLPVA